MPCEGRVSRRMRPRASSFCDVPHGRAAPRARRQRPRRRLRQQLVGVTLTTQIGLRRHRPPPALPPEIHPASVRASSSGAAFSASSARRRSSSAFTYFAARRRGYPRLIEFRERLHLPDSRRAATRTAGTVVRLELPPCLIPVRRQMTEHPGNAAPLGRDLGGVPRSPRSLPIGGSARLVCPPSANLPVVVVSSRRRSLRSPRPRPPAKTAARRPRARQKPTIGRSTTQRHPAQDQRQRPRLNVAVAVAVLDVGRERPQHPAEHRRRLMRGTGQLEPGRQSRNVAGSEPANVANTPRTRSSVTAPSADVSAASFERITLESAAAAASHRVASRRSASTSATPPPARPNARPSNTARSSATVLARVYGGPFGSLQIPREQQRELGAHDVHAGDHPAVEPSRENSAVPARTARSRRR